MFLILVRDITYTHTLCILTTMILDPFEGLAPINEVEDDLIHIRFKTVNHYQECV